VQTDNKFLDDLAKLAAGAVGTVHGAMGEMEAMFNQKMGAMLAGLDLVRREEFDAVKEMAEKARMENEKLSERLALLEQKTAVPKSVKVKTRGAEKAS
jgi:BMFP domain-containing protein YqiC